MPEPTAHNASSTAPTVASKKTVMEEERDVDAPKTVRAVSASSSSHKNVDEIDQDSKASDATSVNVKDAGVTPAQGSSSTPTTGEGDKGGTSSSSEVTVEQKGASKASEIGEGGNTRSKDVDEPDKPTSTNVKGSESGVAKPATPTLDEANTQRAGVTPTGSSATSTNDGSTTTPANAQSSNSGTAEPSTSTLATDEQVGEHGLSPRDTVLGNNVRYAMQVVTSVGPMVEMQSLFPSGGPDSFMMEKSVFDRPLAQVQEALAYYEQLRRRATLTESQQHIVIVAHRTRDDLRRLQGIRDGSGNVSVVDL